MREITELVTLQLAPLRILLEQAFSGTGLLSDESAVIVDALLESELSEVPTHGLFRVAGYLDGLRGGRYNVSADVKLVHDMPLSVLIDGDNALGYRPMMRAVEEAIRIARTNLIGVAGVRNTNEFGRASYYAKHAAAAGFIGLVCQNTLPMLGSPGSLSPTHGNNPLAFVTPGSDALVFDAAWTPRSGGEIARRRLLGLSIPEEWGYLDASGNVTTDPADLSSVLPAVGGAKGFGIAVMVDVLAGALTGSAANVSVPADNSRVGGFALAISPHVFGEAGQFLARQRDGAEAVRSAGGRWPGDRSESARRTNHAAGRVTVARRIYEATIEAIRRVDVRILSNVNQLVER